MTLASHIDTVSPACNAVLPGEPLLMRGWVRDESRRVDGLRVVLDDRDENGGTVAYPVIREDVREGFGDPRGSDSGFVAVVRTSGLAPGSHVARLEALIGDGSEVGFSHRFDVVSPELAQPLRSYIDEYVVDDEPPQKPSPVISIRAASQIALRGWCVDPSRAAIPPLLRLRVGEHAFVAASGLHRPDVAGELGESGYTFAGFVVVVPARALAPGQYQVSLDGSVGDGRSPARSMLMLHVTA